MYTPKDKGILLSRILANAYSPPNQTLGRKLDRFMEMITDTQQILVEQKSKLLWAKNGADFFRYSNLAKGDERNSA